MNDFDKDSLRHDRGALESALREAGCQLIRGNVVRCPWHDDKHPSAGIFQGKDDVWNFRCHKCDITEDVIGILAKARGKSHGDILKDLTPQPTEVKPKKIFPTVAAVVENQRGAEDFYAYTDPQTGTVDLLIVRVRFAGGGKSFLQYRPTPGGFESGAPPKPWPIFNRTRIKSATEVFVVEGEKCAKVLQAVGIVATSSPCGAGKAQFADWSPLAGKTVFLWPDNDPLDTKTGKRVGIAHMEDVARELAKLEPRPIVLWINPDELDLPPKGDVVDYLAPFGGDGEEKKRAIEAVKSLASPTGPAEELSQLLDDTISGKRKAVAFPWRQITVLTRALLPGTVTCICGDPGCGKSFFALQAAWWWHQHGAKVALYELEDDRAYHLNRALAQVEECADVTDDNWVAAHPDSARQMFQNHCEFLDGFGACIDTCPDDPVNLDTLLEWVRKRCVAGCRVIVIDPITVADSGDKPWIADRKFIMAAKGIVRAYGASLVLVTHPKLGIKPGGGTSPLHGMAGGASYPRFAHTVLWMHHYPEPKRVVVRGTCGQFTTSVDRSIRIGKARNGCGSHIELGYMFDPRSLRFEEQGIIIDKKVKDQTEGAVS